MSHFLLRWKFSDSTNSHEHALTSLIERLEGKWESYYTSGGDYDGVGVARFPDTINIDSIRCALSEIVERSDTTLLSVRKEPPPHDNIVPLVPRNAALFALPPRRW